MPRPIKQQITVFIAQFNLKRLTGTPIRASMTIEAVKSFADVSVLQSEGLKIFGFTKKTIKELKKIKPDFIHGFTTVSIIPALIYKFFFNRSTTVIFEMHGWAGFEMKGNFLKRLTFLFMDRFGLRFADRVIAVSNKEKIFVSKYVKSNQKVFVIWEPVDFLPKYKEQEKNKKAGEADAQRKDEDYIEAMEYGMPPNTGFGVSERLFAVLMDKPIRETVFFPLMRQKKSEKK